MNISYRWKEEWAVFGAVALRQNLQKNFTRRDSSVKPCCWLKRCGKLAKHHLLAISKKEKKKPVVQTISLGLF